jgi:hypothetical protein
MDSEQQRRLRIKRDRIVAAFAKRLDEAIALGLSFELTPRVVGKCGQLISCKFNLEDPLSLE